MNDAGNVAEQRQKNVQPEMAAESHLQKYADRRQQDCKDDAYDVHEPALACGLAQQDWCQCRRPLPSHVGSAGLKPSGFTITRSQWSRSRMSSAVLPRNKPFKPLREIAPMTTASARS